MGEEGQRPLSLQRPTHPQWTSRTTPLDPPPPAPSDRPRQQRSSQHPPLAGEQGISTPTLSRAKNKKFRVYYNPTGAPHMESETEKHGNKSKTTRKQKKNNSRSTEYLRLLSATSSNVPLGTLYPGSPLHHAGDPVKASSRGTLRFCPRVGSWRPSTQSRGAPCPESAALAVY